MPFTLDNLSFGDVRRLDTNQLIQNTINQQSIVLHPSSFFYTEILTLEWINVTYASKEAFIAYLKTNAGNQVRMVDYQGHRYTGIIITPVVEFHLFRRPVEKCEGDKGGYTFKIDFAITGTF